MSFPSANSPDADNFTAGELIGIALIWFAAVALLLASVGGLL